MTHRTPIKRLNRMYKSVLDRSLEKIIDGFFSKENFFIVEKVKKIIALQLLKSENHLRLSLESILNKPAKEFQVFVNPYLEVLSKNKFIQDYSIYARRVLLNNYVGKRFNNEVQEGLFTGLKLNSKNIWGGTDRASMILGFYEREVQDYIQKITCFESDRKVFINLGAGDGFYAVGFAKKIPGSKSFAWEIDAELRQAILQLGRQNDVEINLYGEAKSDFYLELPKYVREQKSVILCDVEGAEYQIINEDSLKYFSDAIWIIELHEFTDAHYDLERELIDQASKLGFQVEFLRTGFRDLSKFVESLRLDDVDRWLLCPEGRGPNSGKWLVLNPNLGRN